MNTHENASIGIVGAKTNNLRDISLRIPHGQLVVVTGISGSGKSSLVFEVIAQEGQRRYFETLPAFARQFLGKLNRPAVDEITGLSPVIAIGQRTSGAHARATVGTLSDLYSLLRLLYARTGSSEQNIELSRALFSFNSEVGKCPRCNGIGQEEQIDLNKLVNAPDKTLREGALAPTLPNGYIMYSQVTIDVLNQVCEAEGFSADIPWCDLTEEQQQVILYGSEKIKVPFGKHSLESRLKWTGIKAKPREEGYYKGMIPIMSDILRRDRNANILKYVKAVTCPACVGTRLNEAARSVRVHGRSIVELSTLEIGELLHWLEVQSWKAVGETIVNKLTAELRILADLGLSHLTIDRSASSLRPSEIQRIRIANQLVAPLSDVLYIFDEPSIGLHPTENQRLIEHLKSLVQKGNTVIVVEHDLATIRSADHIIELGPRAGAEGGQLLYNGPLAGFLQESDLAGISPTYRALKQFVLSNSSATPKASNAILLAGCHARNLQQIDVHFQLGQLNVVSGPSGAGKASLVKATLLTAVQQQLEQAVASPPLFKHQQGLEAIDKLVFVDHSPIGRTPRSNPATYLGLANYIRDLYASLPESKARGYSKSRFSFNNKGGCCETCQGAGKTQLGMHFLGNIELLCGTCGGDRFNADTLEIEYLGRSIAKVYQLSVTEAIDFFAEQPKILTGLRVLESLGLGYLKLGQSSTTLSGGEAQRIKIANQLQRKATGQTLYIIIEPTIGLHQDDIDSLLGLFERIKQDGNTIVCIEQDETVIARSDWHIELGPEGGQRGGTVVYQGKPKPEPSTSIIPASSPGTAADRKQYIELRGVSTHGLKNIDVSLPKNQLTVVTGLSGSGKSALVYDTLFAEADARFTESLSTYHRSFLQQNSTARLTSFSGMGPAIGINRRGGAASTRSTVGTLTGVYDALRLLYSRLAQLEGHSYTAQHFSFNHPLGACPACAGKGYLEQCDPEQVIINPTTSILAGATATNKAVQYYADPQGQFMATLRTAAHHYGWDLTPAWQDLPPTVQEAILYGTGNTLWDVNWVFATKSRKGTQRLQATWRGFCHYLNEEYQRKRHNKNVQALKALLHEVTCPTCHGSRLQLPQLEITYRDKNIHELSQLSISTAQTWLAETPDLTNTPLTAITKVVLPPVLSVLETLGELGLNYLTLDRAVRTLSGGERQRVTLAGQLSAQLFGVTYVLDEPTIGLDIVQVEALRRVLQRIIERGNTVVVVEHDPNFIRTADYLIEMGPGAGQAGGQVMYQGPLAGVLSRPDTVTARMLSHRITPDTSAAPTQSNGKSFGVRAATANNLKSIDVTFRSEQLIAVTGVSGSGKSSLVKEVLYRSWERGRPIHCQAVEGLEQFDEILLIGQEALAANRLTTPATYTKLLDPIRALFAQTASAKASGLKKADFSYQSKKGKCPSCNGHGERKTSMDFMSDIWLPCEVCHGLRYNATVLDCHYREHSIGQVLRMTIQEAISFFAGQPIAEKLGVLENVGLGHLVLGQGGHTLSGGEAQRLKLANALLQKRQGATLFLLDEPSTGLHYFDIQRLISVFQTLVKRGDTVLYIEHNAALVQAAQQLVRLGPGGGEKGGKI